MLSRIRFPQQTFTFVGLGVGLMLMMGCGRTEDADRPAALSASDQSAALLENERKFDQGDITSADSVPAEVGKVLDDNQRLMLSMGFGGTPGIVVRESDGLIRKFNGMPQQGQLVEVLGPR